MISCYLEPSAIRESTSSISYSYTTFHGSEDDWRRSEVEPLVWPCSVVHVSLPRGARRYLTAYSNMRVRKRSTIHMINLDLAYYVFWRVRSMCFSCGKGEGLCTQTPIRIVTVEKGQARPALVLSLQIPTSWSIMHCLVQIHMRIWSNAGLCGYRWKWWALPLCPGSPRCMHIWSYDHMNIRYPIGDGYIQGSRLVVVVVVPRDHMRIWSYADTRGTSMGFLTSKAAPLCPDSVGDACAYDHMIIWTSDWWLVIGRVLYHVIICAYEHPQPFFGVSWRVVKKSY